jgi:ParB-like chromosome segregation protein Spo0J
MSAELSSHDVPIDVVYPHPQNPRRGNLDKIKDSLSRFGQVRPIVVNDKNVILAGNHTYRAMKEMGHQFINIVQVDLSDDEAKAYLLADNRTADAATWDDEALIAALEDLQANSELAGTGFTQDDLDDLLSAMDRTKFTEPEPFTGDYAEPPETTEARWADRNEGQNREVVFLLPNEDYETFMDNVQKLKLRYATESMASCVYEAVYRESQFVASPKYLDKKSPVT